MNQQQAIGVGQQALIWLAGRPELLEAFLSSSGAAVEDLRDGSTNAGFLGFVLDHILQSDSLILDFTGEAGIAPEDPARARASLPGGHAPNWT
jgi:hypothetical protein